MNAQPKQATPPPYRPDPAPRMCPDCLGWGAVQSHAAMVVCRECCGTGRPA